MKKLKPILLIVLVFASGVVAGVVGTRLVVRRMVQTAFQNPEIIRERIENDLAVELSLTPEQRPKVHEVIIRSHEEIRKLREDLQPRFIETMKRAENEIAATLTPEQKEKFEKMAKEKKMLWRPPMPFGKPPFQPRGDRPGPMGERRRSP